MNSVDEVVEIDDNLVDFLENKLSNNQPRTAEEAIEKYKDMVYRLVQNRPTTAVCTYDDLVQEGMLAIVNAFQTYDPKFGAGLQTWTYRRIRDSLAQYQKENLLSLSGGASQYQKMKNSGEETPQDAVTKRLVDSFTTANLDEIANVIGDENVRLESSFELPWRQYLEPDEITVLELLYGFRGPTYSLPEIGQRMGRSRKSVDYIKNKALQKLKNMEGIEDFFFN